MSRSEQHAIVSSIAVRNGVDVCVCSSVGKLSMNLAHAVSTCVANACMSVLDFRACNYTSGACLSREITMYISSLSHAHECIIYIISFCTLQIQYTLYLHMLCMSVCRSSTSHNSFSTEVPCGSCQLREGRSKTLFQSASRRMATFVLHHQVGNALSRSPANQNYIKLSKYSSLHKVCLST